MNSEEGTVMVRTRMLGVVCGLLAAAVGLAVAEGLASIIGGPSPVVAVGTWAIDSSPQGITEWAIRNFRANDKKVLVTGVLSTVVVLGALAGAIGVRAKRVGVGLTATVGAIGVLAVATVRGVHDNPVVRVSPALAALAVSTAGMWWLLTTMPKPVPAVAAVGAPPLEVPTEPLRASGLLVRERVEAPAPAADGPERPAVMIPGRRRAPGMDRRDFMRGAVALGAIGTVGVGAWRWDGSNTAVGAAAGTALPRPASPAATVANADFGIPGLSPYFTPTGDFYRVDTSIVIPQVNAATWKLKITGMVDNPITITYDDLLRGRLIERDVTLTCVSNEVGGDLIGNARWLGVPVRDVLRAAGIRPGADAIKSSSVDGWTAGTPLTALTDPNRDAMFAIGMNGAALPAEHGYPVRLVVPGLYGFVSATKWVTHLEVTRFADFEAYWTKRGWSAQAPIKTESRLELPVPYGEIKPGATTIAGVAWAQHRGIRKVEVQVDDQPWRTATLAPWSNPDTWRQWKIDWDAPKGTHNLSVRATDGTGAVQVVANASPVPDGATGYPNALARVIP
ncbi:MAG TPA: molybdopterin-dependent oxidoreductase [Sporichthyaceae bacterium]|jgi:DMSO/TMAO reductase YedYZ molybdopterin-dependent catalytic subunit